MRNVDLFDNYLTNNLSENERISFEQKLIDDSKFANEFAEHKQLISILQQQQKKLALKVKLKEIHKDAFGEDNIIYLGNGDSFFKKYIKPFSVAASIAIIAVVSTVAILSLGGYLIKNQNESITELYKKVEQLENNDKIIINKISPGKRRKFAPANIEGTGFAINNKGYFLTSLHMVKDADSIFIENKTIEHCAAHVVHTDNRLDLAILKIDHSDSFVGKDLPWAFKSQESDLGEKIFTLGYPSSSIVYGEGAISSSSGSGDTAMYQISIPVNPGNSGGPLFDEHGYIVGLVRGKNAKAEGTGFAIKAEYIFGFISKIEDNDLKKELTPAKRNSIKFLKRSEQVKKIEPFVFNVKIYKAN